MQVVFRLAYSLAVAILFVLFVILGTRTFYAEPEIDASLRPVFSGMPAVLSGNGPSSLYCDFNGGYCNPSFSRIPTPEELQPIPLAEARRLFPDAVKQLEEEDKRVREYNAVQQRHQDDLVDYRRNVFIIANVLGVMAVGAALYLFGSVEAMPLGLLLGGIGVVIFGWVQAADDFDEIGTEPLFAVAAVGLVLVLAAGYRFLGRCRSAGESG